jgi:hypothetical protein
MDHKLGRSLTKEASLGEEFVLCENGGMIFHWADYHETCDLVKNQIDQNPDLKDDFHRRENNLKRLQLIPVWIKTETKIFQSTIYELYEKYVLGQNGINHTIDPFYPLEISFISGTGPFKTMAITDCFNKTTYRDFILVYLLQGKLPRRDYRIRLKSKVILEHGKDFGEAELVSIEQLTSKGILFSVEADVFFKHISASTEEVRILINSDMLKDGLKKNLSELKSYLSQHVFSLLYSSKKEDAAYCLLRDFELQSSFDFGQSKKIYLFMKYDRFKSQEKLEALKSFVDHTKTLVHDHYRQDSVEERSIA